jgi:hypothetical protein
MNDGARVDRDGGIVVVTTSRLSGVRCVCVCTHVCTHVCTPCVYPMCVPQSPDRRGSDSRIRALERSAAVGGGLRETR